MYAISTIYIWIYYTLFVLVNPYHPYETFAIWMIVGSFFGLPVLFFIVIPFLNIKLGLKFARQEKEIVRGFIYFVLSLASLFLILNIHTVFSNHLVERKLFPNGIEEEFPVAFENLKQTIHGGVTYIDGYYFEKPFQKNITAANMSGTSEASLVIDYILSSCTECRFTYKEKYDYKSGELLGTENTLFRTKKKWAEQFEGSFLSSDKGEFTIYLVSHMDDGWKINLRTYNPYLNIAAIIEHSEPSFVKGRIIEIQQDESIVSGEEIKYHKNQNGDTIVSVDKVEFIRGK
ncbi:hypothetical protein J2T56_003247 [Natronobacillus azotifigens]|uniref:Uncharacterized protein n=1 Tax=Natronobacillus azotifigens TaxID=472978 RepID=A0A9J6RH36_9BACI|nr:hypothetical protein [Natronobacillus azotifigens]MCZ0704643.1 hypothetical protein [Natronobacillus azotifigens]